MRAPEITYGYTSPKDTAGPTFQILQRSSSLSTGLTAITFLELEVGKDQVLVLANAVIRLAPGATQAAQVAILQITTGTGFQVELRWEEFAEVADQNETLNWQGEVYVNGGGQGTTSLRFYSQYDAGANANTTSIAYSGLIIPRGNAGAF